MNAIEQTRTTPFYNVELSSRESWTSQKIIYDVIVRDRRDDQIIKHLTQTFDDSNRAAVYFGNI